MVTSIFVPALLDFQPTVLALDVAADLDEQLVHFCVHHLIASTRCGALRDAVAGLVTSGTDSRLCRPSRGRQPSSFLRVKQILSPASLAAPPSWVWVQDSPKNIANDICGFLIRQEPSLPIDGTCVDVLSETFTATMEWITELPVCSRMSVARGVAAAIRPRIVLLNTRKKSAVEASRSTQKISRLPNGISIMELPIVNHHYGREDDKSYEVDDTRGGDYRQTIRLTPIHSVVAHHSADSDGGRAPHHESVAGTGGVSPHPSQVQQTTQDSMRSWAAVSLLLALCLLCLGVFRAAVARRKFCAEGADALTSSGHLVSRDIKVVPIGSAQSYALESTAISVDNHRDIQAKVLLVQLSNAANQRLLRSVIGRWRDALKPPALSDDSGPSSMTVVTGALSEETDGTVIIRADPHAQSGRALSFSIAAASLLVTPTFPCPVVSAQSFGGDSCLEAALGEVNRLLKSVSATGDVLDLVEAANKRRHLHLRSAKRIQRAWRNSRHKHGKAEEFTQRQLIPKPALEHKKLRRVSFPATSSLDGFGAVWMHFLGSEGAATNQTISSA